MATEDLVKQMRSKRLERHVSQGELGTMLNVSQEMISMMESGTKSVPDELAPIIRRWIATGSKPGKLALAARRRARSENSGG